MVRLSLLGFFGCRPQAHRRVHMSIFPTASDLTQVQLHTVLEIYRLIGLAYVVKARLCEAKVFVPG